MALSLDIDQELGAQLDTQAGLAPLPTTGIVEEVAKQMPAAQTALAAKENAPAPKPLDVLSDIAPANHLLSCREMLDPSSLEGIKAYAVKNYPALVDDPNRLGDFGREAVEPLNRLADDLLNKAGRAANIPALKAITNGLDDTIRGFTRKYDAKALAESDGAYTKIKENISHFIGKWGNVLHKLLRDAQGIQKYLNSLEAQLEDYRNTLRENVAMCNQLYKENEKALGKLIVVIAAMEYVRDMAAADAGKIQLTGSVANDQQLREERRKLVEFIQALDVRIGEFQQRLMVAFATGPQVANIRAISYGLGQRLALLQILTIPTFKLTIVQWVALQQAAEAGHIAEAVGSANDAALTAFASAGAQVVPQVAKQIQTPSTSPSTILAVANSLAAQAKGITDAYEQGIIARKTVSEAIVQGAQIITDAEDTQAKRVLELVSGATAPGQISDTKSVIGSDELPEFVRNNANSVLSTGTLAA